MNYDKMSNFEINQAVARHSGFVVSAEHECVKTGSCFLLTSNYDEMVEFNPCNNPSDMWPLMIESKISIICWGGYWEAQAYHPSGDKHITHHENPFRAAAICYLKMKER